MQQSVADSQVNKRNSKRKYLNVLGVW